MSVSFPVPIIPAATLGKPYAYHLEAAGGIAPYSFAIISGSLPPGLVMLNDGSISGTPSQVGVYSVTIEVTDSDTVPTQTTGTFRFTCLDVIDLSNLTVEHADFVEQLTNALSVKSAWSTGITSQTSQTIIELTAAIGTFLTAKLNRVKEDSFSTTAQSDSALMAIASTQGLRLPRKMPASATISISSDFDTSIPPFTQFSGGGFTWFNADQVVLRAGVPITTVIHEGIVKRVLVNGLGTNLQSWVATESGFVISDQHVQVQINGAVLYKTFEGLWNYPRITADGTQQLAFADRTLPDGRLLVQFGSQAYGAIPSVNDEVLITYAITRGEDLNATTTREAKVTVVGYNRVTAEFTSNPTGGATQRNPVAYKNFGVGTFGTFSSGVTKAQYTTVVNSYPGIIDTVTRAQREINPAALAWMNVVRISALTNTQWTQPQIRAYLDYCQSQTMYTTYFVWQDPIPVMRDVDVSVFCFNSVQSTAAVKANVQAAIEKLFSARSGLLLTNFYESDIIETAKNAAPNQVAYVVVNKPTQPMTVTNAPSPISTYTVVPGSGVLAPGAYAYGISANTPLPNVMFQGLFEANQFSNFPNASEAGQYWLVSRDGNLRDPVTGSLTPVQIGQQLLATGPGNLAANFNVISDPQGVVEIGSPANFTYPQVASPNSAIVLDWSSTPVDNVIQYFVWGRNSGAVGVLAAIDRDTMTFRDDGSYTPVLMPTTAYNESPIRYNSLRNLKVSVGFAERQSSASLPVRDTL